MFSISEHILIRLVVVGCYFSLVCNIVGIDMLTLVAIIIFIYKYVHVKLPLCII